MKPKKQFVCQKCGAISATWLGRCPNCKEWDTFTEEIIIQNEKNNFQSLSENRTFKIDEIITDEKIRVSTNNSELDRVLGGGIISGSLILLSGEPGIGKSTLILQVALQLEKKILIVSGEESLNQIKLRANRLSSSNPNLYLLSETNIENILSEVDKLLPEIVVIDSIQTLQTNTLDTSIGNLSQIRQCASIIQNYAKQKNIAFIIIGHITKDGSIAGPKLLEHIVDTVLQFEGDNNHSFRILRSNKNRFGSTSEIGIYDMTNSGLVEIANPSDLLLSNNLKDYSGVSVGTVFEGTRPFLIEIQALVGTAVYGTPQRSSSTFDIRRLNMLLAVLEKKIGLKLLNKDVFINIAGGIKISDPGIDLPIITSIVSSDVDVSIPRNFCFCGEVSLTGEIRPVQKTENRIKEVQKLGFKKIFIPKLTKNINEKEFDIEIIRIETINELFQKLFVKK